MTARTNALGQPIGAALDDWKSRESPGPEPIQVAGTRIDPGDWLVGDADGVVAVPQDRASDVLAAALEIAAAEERIRTAVEAGSRLDDARKQEDYHALQSRRRS